MVLEVIDFPKYLSEHSNKVNNVKVVCVLNRQVNMPEHLKPYDVGGSNIPSLVDLVGIDIDNKQYLVQGQAVVMLGPRAYESTTYGKRVLLLRGDAFLRDTETDYVEILLMFSRNDTLSLYATKVLYRELPDMRNVYPELLNKVDELAQMNWDFDKFYAMHPTPMGYRKCSRGMSFDAVSKSEEFVFKSEEDYRKSRVGLEYSSSTEEIPNTIQTHRENVPALVSRNSIKELPHSFKEIGKLIDIAKDKVEKEKDKLISFIGCANPIRDIDYLYRALKNNWRRNPIADAVTGRALLKNVLEHMYPEYASKYVNGVPFIDYALDSNNILDIWYTGNIPSNLQDSDFYMGVSGLREMLNIGVIDYLLSLRGNLIEAYRYSKCFDLDIYSVLSKNPYYLTIIDSRLTIEDLDKLGMFCEVNLKDPEVIKFRNAAYLHNFMLDTNNEVVSENTIVLKSEVIDNISNGVVINSKSFKNLQTTGYVLSDKVLANLKCFIKSNLNINNFKLPRDGWRERKQRGTSKYILPIFKSNKNEEVMNDYLEVGLGIEQNIKGKTYVMDYIYAVKEQFIIKKLYELQINGEKYKIENDKVEQCIRGFERLKSLEWNMPNFKLETKQADAVRLLYNPIMCLTGSAGSGKTTTAEAILYALQALYGIDEDSIMFCAPTGRAANRLREIVKKPTRTINSLFAIGSESYTLLDEEKVKKKSDISVLIVDESSMINLNLMYSMLMKICDGTRIIFLGDRAQLPPIGPGKPFANLLTFLPCVVLNVPKRAAENSGITKNADLLLTTSDNAFNMKELSSTPDFRLLPESKENIVKLVQGIVNYHLGRAGEKRTTGRGAERVVQTLGVDLDPDDIQVVTPINKYEWGTKNLNMILQEVFNSKANKTDYSIRYVSNIEYVSNSMGVKERVLTYSELRVKDRVIHLKNHADAERYLYLGGNTFQAIHTSTGVMNGDIGKIVGFFKGCDLVFKDSDGKIDDKVRESFADSDEVLYIGVQYLDVDETGNPLEYIIFYKCDISTDVEDMQKLRSEKVYTVSGMNLSLIDLAYALTVHKLQGSQAKLIIFILFPVGYSNFISRNIIYTGVTRAEKGIYVIGDVLGGSSILNRGRRIEQNALKVTITDKLFDLDS